MEPPTSSVEVVYRHILRKYPVSEEKLRIINVVVTGSMSAGAMVSPVLFEIRGLWFGAITVFFSAMLIFTLQHGEQMKMYGPFTLVPVIFLGFAAYSSARTSLRELVPWVPLTIWLFAFLTVYCLPKVHEHWTPPRENLERQMEEGLANGPLGFSMEVFAAAQPDAYEMQLETISTRQFREQTVAGMDRMSPQFGSAGSLSVSEASINLTEDGRVAQPFGRAVNVREQIFLTERLFEDFQMGRSSRRMQETEPTRGHPRCFTDSTDVNESNPDSQRSDLPLLG